MHILKFYKYVNTNQGCQVSWDALNSASNTETLFFPFTDITAFSVAKIKPLHEVMWQNNYIWARRKEKKQWKAIKNPGEDVIFHYIQRPKSLFIGENYPISNVLCITWLSGGITSLRLWILISRRRLRSHICSSAATVVMNVHDYCKNRWIAKSPSDDNTAMQYLALIKKR